MTLSSKRTRHLRLIDGSRQERAAQQHLHPIGQRRDVLTVVPLRPRPVIDPPTRPAA